MMRKFYCLIILLLSSFYLYADHFTYPVISQQAPTLQKFIPGDWKILDVDMGDLNKDGYPDIAFVITNENQCDTPEPENPDFKVCPRLLGIAFWDNEKQTFVLKEQTNNFIKSADSSTMDEPFEGITIRKGSLQIDFHYWYSMGTWYTTNDRYIFRYQNDHFELIGFAEDTTHRATLETTQISVNYSTKQIILTTGEGETGKSESETIPFNIDKLYTFANVNDQDISRYISK